MYQKYYLIFSHSGRPSITLIEGRTNRGPLEGPEYENFFAE